MLMNMKMRFLLLCIAIGAAAGGAMIFTHHGPGINARKSPASPQARNATRTNLLQQLAAALTQYQKDHGSLPVTLTSTATQVCAGSGSLCTQYRLADLSFLTTEGNYVPTLPVDPLGGEGVRGSGFFISAQPDGSLKLSAPEAEANQTIEVNFTP